jgi:hypothetical protein
MDHESPTSCLIFAAVLVAFIAYALSPIRFPPLDDLLWPPDEPEADGKPHHEPAPDGR